MPKVSTANAPDAMRDQRLLRAVKHTRRGGWASGCTPQGPLPTGPPPRPAPSPPLTLDLLVDHQGEVVQLQDVRQLAQRVCQADLEETPRSAGQPRWEAPGHREAGTPLAPLWPFAEKLQEPEREATLRGDLGGPPNPDNTEEPHAELGAGEAAHVTPAPGHPGEGATQDLWSPGWGRAEGGMGRTRGAGSHRATLRCWGGHTSLHTCHSHKRPDTRSNPHVNERL